MNILHQQFPWQRFPMFISPSDSNYELCLLVLAMILEYLLSTYKLISYKCNEAANVNINIIAQSVNGWYVPSFNCLL